MKQIFRNDIKLDAGEVFNVIQTGMNIWLLTDTNVGYIWNVHDAFILREKHRILGSWIGCPSQAFQSSNATLPLLLMPEEIDCLIR